jgi:hypothetical protein
MELTGGLLSKAVEVEDPENEGQETAPGGADEDSAENAPLPDQPSDQDPKSMFWDPYAIMEALGYRDRPSQLSYGTLKSMVYRMPIVQAIIKLRVDQVAAFCQPQPDEFRIGYKVKTRESKKEPTPAERDWSRQAETLLFRTGVTENPRGRDNLRTFVKKYLWDSLTYDQGCFEVVPDRQGRPCEFYAVDGATMRLADSTKIKFDEDEESIRYVQVYDSMVVAEFTARELCWGVRNPRADIRLAGYGVSELEMLVSCVTAMLYGWDYNSKFFTQGSSAKGILNFKGAIPEKSLKAFRRHWYALLAGITGSWRTPITNAEDIQWINMQQSNRDMEFSAWMDFLIKVACSMYSTDPIEVNFQYGNQGQKSSLQQASNREKIQESKERGLRPLLEFVAASINEHILWPINENFSFEFVGLDAMTKEQKAEHNTKLVKSTKTVDEIRAMDDDPPLPDGKGEVILDPTWLQFATAKDAAAQQGMGGGEMGEGQPDMGMGGDEGENGAQAFDEETWMQMLGQGGEQGGEQPPGPVAMEAEPAQKSLEPGGVRLKLVI